MSTKVPINFNFTIPVLQVLNPTNKEANLLGHLEIAGKAILSFGEELPDIQYSTITWQHTNLLKLFDNYSPADELMQSIYNATINHLKNNNLCN